jgi:hypothetical protein
MLRSPRIILIIISSLVLVSCQKKEVYYPIQNSFKEWVLFQKGSYWIYSDKKNNKIDSTYILYGPTDFISDPSYDNHLYQYIHYTQSDIGDYIIYATENDSYLMNQNGITGGVSIISNTVVSGNSEIVTKTCWVIERFDSLILENNVFYRVIHVRDTNSQNINYAEPLAIDYYMAYKIGVIKVSLKTNHIDSTLTLVRWHVIQ